MIIELQYYCPPDGRQYESPLGGEVPAISRIRFDCVECSYTKVKIQQGEDLLAEITRYFEQTSKLLKFTSVQHLQWYEVLLVKYRCGQEKEPHCVAAVDHTLVLYGAASRPTRLKALLGPPAQEPEQPDEEPVA